MAVLNPRTERTAATVDLRLYLSLRKSAAALAEAILNSSTSPLSSSQAGYFSAEARRLSGLQIGEVETVPSVAGDILQFLELNISGFLSGEEKIEILLDRLKKQVGLFYWLDLMTKTPMSAYAVSCADFLIDNDLLGGRSLELGAGCGNLSKLIDKKTHHLIRTDKRLDLLNRSYGHENAAYDFDQDGSWSDLDLVVAVNALHCAYDKKKSLQFISKMMKPGGYLVLAEGQDEVRPGEPWSLNLLFGLFDGWWDRSGFLDRAKWLGLLEETGFVEIGKQKMISGEFDLGGLLWARKA